MTPSLEHPIEFDQTPDYAAAGVDPHKLENLREIFYRQIEEGLHPAAQMVVLRRGQVVLDIVGGRGRGQAVTPQTPFLCFSMTKSFTGMCIHELLEEGKLEWDAPIAEYWPEFGCKGKQTATIRNVFHHQAGIPTRHMYRQIPLVPFWSRITQAVAELEAEFEPGTQTAYHLLNYGVIFGEVIRRVSGMPFPQFLRQTILEPLGLQHTWIGKRPVGMPRPLWLSASDPNPLRESWFHYASAALFNFPAIRNAIMPAANLHSTARDVAIFYQMVLNKGRYAGKQLLQPQTVEKATSLGVEDYDHTILAKIRWAHGFYLGGLEPPEDLPGPEMGHGSSISSFGHFGMATSMAWADRDAELAVVFTCNRILDKYRASQRYTQLSDAVWDSLK